VRGPRRYNGLTQIPRTRIATEGMSDRSIEAPMKLSIRIVKDEKGQYRATCKSLPGCVINADSRRDVYAKMQDAIRGYIASVGNCAPNNEVRLVEH